VIINVVGSVSSGSINCVTHQNLLRKRDSPPPPKNPYPPVVRAIPPA
jgi:hypothetical protein